MIQITKIHMAPGGTHHQHIELLYWTNLYDRRTGESTRQQMVDYLRNPSNQAYSSSPQGITAYLKVVEATPPYVQTYADETPTDNLLLLDRY